MEADSATTNWIGNLTPIGASDWTYDRARHLLDRAGFGGTPDDITRLYRMGPEAAVAFLVDLPPNDDPKLAAFDESPIYDPTLRNFPPTRPTATRLAAKAGSAMGVSVKPSGDRRLQPVVDRFFYWLRASSLETKRLAHWWAECMLLSDQPLREKMALFWHGHFATGADKVRDYRKMKVQLALLRAQGTGNFRTLLVGVAKDPAMLVFLDAGRNVKGAPNENFGREVMELFTMGVGNYTEQDVREGARAFTGWIDDDLIFGFDASKHDAGMKTFLGHTGPFDGVAVLDIILEQPVTSVFIASKMYRFLVNEDPSPDLQQRLGAVLRDGNYEIRPFLRTLFLSRDFYSVASMGAQIKGPVELIVSTYRQLGLTALPGIPDINSASDALGQVLLNPPTVAGWAQGRAWITPATLIERGNFARDVLFPDQIDFTDPNLDPGAQIREVNARILRGMNVAAATTEEAPGGSAMMGERAMANVEARQEEFNTRLGSLHGWQQAVRKVKPIVRAPAQFSLAEIVLQAEARTTADAVDVLLVRFLGVPVDDGARATLIAFLDAQLGTSDIAQAQTYLEEPLRLTTHLIMSRPEYQLV
ncbi:DUF1800 domain-containing protein [Rhodopila globiformis]|uniref:DUF1800 domain-containing protein n=1 Tax=Rhodopila globiformis TaxID=1071 RepID=A0A2S6NJW5_RHOGL|nr:DUF1800 domain-containing protein [Rhodopila globiformis]PPQ35210.1 hypothetical protein CCS01_08385 [Rhodopila globiformis]